jgi:hypothetical protein
MALEFLESTNGCFDIADIVVDILKLVHEQERCGVRLRVLVVKVENCRAECGGVILLENEALAAVQGQIEVSFFDLKILQARAERSRATGMSSYETSESIDEVIRYDLGDGSERHLSR